MLPSNDHRFVGDLLLAVYGEASYGAAPLGWNICCSRPVDMTPKALASTMSNHAPRMHRTLSSLTTTSGISPAGPRIRIFGSAGSRPMTFASITPSNTGRAICGGAAGTATQASASYRPLVASISIYRCGCGKVGRLKISSSWALGYRARAKGQLLRNIFIE